MACNFISSHGILTGLNRFTDLDWVLIVGDSLDCNYCFVCLENLEVRILCAEALNNAAGAGSVWWPTKDTLGIYNKGELIRTLCASLVSIFWNWLIHQPTIPVHVDIDDQQSFIGYIFVFGNIKSLNWSQVHIHHTWNSMLDLHPPMSRILCGMTDILISRFIIIMRFLLLNLCTLQGLRASPPVHGNTALPCPIIQDCEFSRKARK